jgi:hypothetical protein
MSVEIAYALVWMRNSFDIPTAGHTPQVKGELCGGIYSFAVK